MSLLRTALVTLVLSAALCACDGTDDGPAQNNVPPADAATAVEDAGATCTCLEVTIQPTLLDLCDCPEWQYGCAEEPKTYEGACDIAPPCWSLTTDPETGCPIPEAEDTTLRPECSCTNGFWGDAGVRD